MVCAEPEGPAFFLVSQGLGKTITTIALIMSNKAPPRPTHEPLPPGPAERASPALAETVNLDDYKEVFVTSAEDEDDELMEIAPEHVQLRLEYRPGGTRESSQPRGDVRRDVIEGGGAELMESDIEKPRGGKTEAEAGGAEAAPMGGFLQDRGWGLGNAEEPQAAFGGVNDWEGLRLQNGVLLAEGGRASSEEAGEEPIVRPRKRKGVAKEEGKAGQPESSSGGEPRDPLSRRGRPPAGTLIVCPTSVLRQWANEVRDKVAPGERLKLLIYHGVGRTKDPHEVSMLRVHSACSMLTKCYGFGLVDSD